MHIFIKYTENMQDVCRYKKNADVQILRKYAKILPNTQMCKIYQ